MRRLKHKTFYFITILILVSCDYLNAQNLFDKEYSLRFTNYLFDKELYHIAIPELERVNFQFEGEDSLQFLLLKSYRKAGELEKGIERASQIFSEFTKPKTLAAQEYFKLLALQGELNSANQLLNGNRFIDKSVKDKYSIHLLLLNKNWQSASEAYENIANKNDVACYKPLIEEGKSIRYKNSLMAGSLSAIIPGSGKVYTGFWQDGLLSFISIGIMSWQSYTGFEKDGSSSAYGWTFAGISGILYLANVYGSAKSAKYINHYNEQKVIHKVQHCFDDDF